jgi:hypothetical protein
MIDEAALPRAAFKIISVNFKLFNKNIDFSKIK